VFPVERDIEKNELIKNSTSINFKDNTNNHFLYSKFLFDKISTLKKANIASSMLTIYNYKFDSTLYSKRIRDISNEAELEIYLTK
jgi:hypothetical protein